MISRHRLCYRQVTWFRDIPLAFLIGLFSGPTLPALAQTDPMLPTSSSADAITSPLVAVTVLSHDLLSSREFYEGALAMTATPISLNDEEAQQLKQYWNLPLTSAVEGLIFSNPSAPGSGVVRVLKAPPGTPSGRPDLSSRYSGPLGFGFPDTDMFTRLAEVERRGFSSTVGITEMNFSRADGSEYTVSEVHYVAPDDTLVLGVDRGSYTQIGSINPVTGIGGVAYSSFIVDSIEQSSRFFHEVLGYELRREMTFRSSGQGMPDTRKGESIAFLQWFSPGATTGYLVMMELLDDDKKAYAALGMASSGLSMWSFTTDSLDTINSRWQAYSGETAEVFEGRVPPFGIVRSIQLTSPSGIPIEIIQR